ncbi:PucR family transcriptional regulator [Amycolatopsis orientalis]|uniref:PucR family transcriptional regulator n=1 Tax=Amycolatopsis orientalis TaxID=31958 RepID=UPI000AF9425E|nr:PucR family transcriptional regulator [Amycolatopsis orientalis]
MTQAHDPLGSDVNVPLRAVVGNPELALDPVVETLRPGALDAPVRWAHVSELRDPAPYLLGAELLLTAGVNLPVEPREIDRYVRRLADSGISALGFGLTPGTYETLPPPLRTACARYRLPLLIVPPRTPFLAISRAVSVALAEAGKREQRRIAVAREALTRAAGAGLGELASTLGGRLRAWVALVGAGDVLAADHGTPSPLPAEVGELLATLRAGRGIRSATTELPDGTHVVAQPVYPQATASHLVVVGRPGRFDGADRSILSVGAALLGLVGRAGSDAAGPGAAATALLLGETDAIGGEERRLVAGIAYRRGPDEVAARYDWLRARLDTPFVRLRPGPRFDAIVREAPEIGDLDRLRADGWLAVVASPVPPDRLPEAATEVELLLKRAAALERPVVAEAAGLGLDALITPEAAAGFAAQVLAPLRELDTKGDRELVETLRTWLAHHGGWDRTAAELGVHRNSVRHRIGQIERALGADLADPEIRMRLWFALRWAS